MLGNRGDYSIQGSTSAGKTGGWLCPSIDTMLGATTGMSSSTRQPGLQLIRAARRQLTEMQQFRGSGPLGQRHSVEGCDLGDQAADGRRTVVEEGHGVPIAIEEDIRPSLGLDDDGVADVLIA